MLNALLLVVLMTPLMGIWELEHGAFSITYGRVGTPNGAFTVFMVYVGLVYGSYLLTRPRGPIIDWKHKLYAIDNQRFRDQTLISLVICVFFLLLVLFGAGSISVLLNNVGKGEFRASLGGLGSTLYMAQRWILPALAAYVAVLYRVAPRNVANTSLLVITIFSVALFGASWGFTSSAITAFVPAIIVIYRRMKLKTLLVFSAGILGALLFFAAWFGRSDTGAGQLDLLDFIWARLTTIQGDVPWGVWGSYQEGVRFPDFSPTLLAALGDRVLEIFFGVNPDDFNQWAHYHFDVVMDLLTGASAYQIMHGHSVTGTVFTEGLVAGGLPGVGFFSVFAGVVAGLVERLIVRFLENMRYAEAITTAIYAFLVIVWINSGGIIQIFHISVLVGLLVSYALIKGIGSITFQRSAPPKTRAIILPSR